MKQPTLFDIVEPEMEKLTLYALGDFQSRGLKLAERELPLDRLLGAFRRASEKFQIKEPSDAEIAETLRKLGAEVKEIPPFFAKHPFRIKVPLALAEQAKSFFESQNNESTAKPE